MSDTLSWAGWRISDEGNGGQRKLEANQRGGAGVRQASLAPVGSALDKGEPGGQLSLSGGEGGIRTLERRLAPTRFPVAPVRPLRHLSEPEPKPIPGGHPDRRWQLYPGPAITVHRRYQPVAAGRQWPRTLCCGTSGWCTGFRLQWRRVVYLWRKGKPSPFHGAPALLTP